MAVKVYEMYWEVYQMIKTENEELERSISLGTLLMSLQIGWDKDVHNSIVFMLSIE